MYYASKQAHSLPISKRVRIDLMDVIFSMWLVERNTRVVGRSFVQNLPPQFFSLMCSLPIVPNAFSPNLVTRTDTSAYGTLLRPGRIRAYGY